MRTSFDHAIIRAYDMRGTHGVNLFDHDAYLLGKRLLTYLKNHYPSPSYTVAVARDGRISSPGLSSILSETLAKEGVLVWDLGVAPSPLAYFVSATEAVDAVIVITASHNPAEDNGFKILIKNQNIFGDTLKEFATLLFDVKDACEEDWKSRCLKKDFLMAYLRHNIQCLKDVKKKPLKIAWDFSSGSMAVMAPFIKDLVPGTHVFLNDTVDGTFPGHPPDPTIEVYLKKLKEIVISEKCDIGIAFDGDGDRLGVLDHTGDFIEGDRITAILAQDVLEKHPGTTILMDIKSSRACLGHIERLGGHAQLTRTGHSFIKARLREEKALMAGEMSGHVFFADENLGYDDGFYAALRLMRWLQNSGKTLHELNAAFPYYPATPEVRLPCEDELKLEIVETIKKLLLRRGLVFRDDDGVRVESDAGFWLLRASNTSDYLIFRAEGVDEHALQLQKDLFRDIYSEVTSQMERT